MKVLYVINGLGTGGAERSLAEMLPKLVERGVDLTVACLHRRKEGMEETVIAAGHKVVFLDHASWLSSVRRLRFHINSLRPDVLHTTIFESDLIGRTAAVSTGVPVVSSIVNTNYSPVRLADPNIKRWKLRAAQALDGWTARHLTTRFHALTEVVREATVESLGVSPERVEVIGRGRDIDRLGTPSIERRRKARQMLGIDPETPLVLTVGRREFQKGQHYLIAAIATVAASIPHVQLLVAGRDGSASEALARQVAELSLDGIVRFLGHRNDVPELLAAADVFAFPSVYEGFGGAVIEAMGMSVPVAAFDIPAVREVVRGTAALVPIEDVAALGAAVADLLSDRGRASEQTEQAYGVFMGNYTLDAVVDRMITLYETAIALGR